MTGCRIGKIKLKGGAQLHIIDTVRPQKSIIDMLQDELVKARSGDTVSIAVASTTRNGCTNTRYFIAAGQHDLLLAGVVEHVKHRILSDI